VGIMGRFNVQRSGFKVGMAGIPATSAVFLRITTMPRLITLLICTALLSPLAAHSAFAQAQTAQPAPTLKVGDVLPQLEGDFLTGRDALLPDAAKGKVALVMLGFTYGSRASVEAWSEWFKKSFGGRGAVTFFEVPMIGGFGRLGRWFIDSGMRKGTPKTLHENVITVYGGTGDWKKRMDYRDEKAAYLLILDKEGIVRWRYSGAYDEEAAREVDQVVRSLSDPIS